MSARELPEDVREWPADPFALLGVEPGADEVEVKRAYTRLIRRFKPERFPEQFRRIREAYEACLDRHRFFLPRIVFDTPADPTEQPEPAAPSPPADDVARLWAAALDGRDAEAYAGLADLAVSRPDRSDVPLRLYWLLATSPALDAARTRHDWLAEALRRARLRGPAAELYRRELDADAQAALYGPYLRLLESPADTRDLVTLARWRAEAAGHGRYPNAALADLEAVRDRLRQDEPAWLGLLAGYVDWAAWDRPHPLYDACREEFARLRHLELSHGPIFDRVDAAEHVSGGWHVMPVEWQRVVRAAWASHGELRWEEVGPVVAAAAAEPAQTVVRFDRVLRTIGPGAVFPLLAALDRFRRHHCGDEPDFPPDLLRGLVRTVADPGRFPNYSWVRMELLDFLAAEAVDPLELAAACAGDADYRVRGLADRLREDPAVRLAWLSCRLHRGPG